MTQFYCNNINNQNMFVSHYKPLKLKSNQLVHTFMRVGWLTLEGKFQTLFSCSCSLRGCSRGTPPILAAPACVTEPRSWRAGECEPCACVSEWGSFQIHPHLEQSKNQRNTADLRSAELLEPDWSRLTLSLHTPAWRTQPAELFWGCGCCSWFRRRAQRWEARSGSGCRSALIGWPQPSSGKSCPRNCPGTTFLHWRL